jgi:gliding motility-associated-like protein
LPTTSNNAINGAWSPALNNTTTTLYTFTPTAGQCANTTTLSITVNSGIIPTFTAVPPICTGETIAALPTTSNNAINGTWAPAINNTSTTIYTFTPATGQCANTTTLTITVNTGVTPTFTAVPPICAGGVISPLPTTSTNAINGTWSPVLNNTATTIYTFTPTTGQCANTTSLTVTINTAPILLISNPAVVCRPLKIDLTDPAITAGSTAGSQITYWLNNLATSPLTFASTVGTDGTYYIKSTLGGCSTIQPVTVTIKPRAVADFTPSKYEVSNFNTAVNFTNQSSDATNYSWTFGDGSGTVQTNPSHIFPDTIASTYEVTLVANNIYDCPDTLIKTITVYEELLLFIPNTFTPDDNKFNQIFKPVITAGFLTENYNFIVFNRWGEIVFETKDIKEGWDGTTVKGELSQDGTYTWQIFITESRYAKRKVLTGHVNILR